MPLRFCLDPDLTDDLRERIVRLWVDVTNAGGAVGFVGRVGPEDVRPLATRTLEAVTRGDDRLLVAWDGDDLVGLLFLVGNGFPLKDHWRVVKRVMIAPGSQGRGHGRALMLQAASAARRMGLDALQLTVRGGTGTEAFYARLGYREVGRLPGALRLAPGDDQDEIVMWRELGDA